MIDKLVYPKYSIGTKVKVYRAFQGYCGDGVIVKSMPTGLIPTYIIKLLSGSYICKLAPVEIAVNENQLKVVQND